MGKRLTEEVNDRVLPKESAYCSKFLWSISSIDDSQSLFHCLFFNHHKWLFENTGIWADSSAGRAPALQAGGHRFDPGNLHQNGPVAQLARAYD